MKWLIVGCGSIGRRHLSNLRSIGETDLTVYRSRRTNVDEVEREFGVRSCFSLDRALADKPDAVVICNPTSLHVPVALAAVCAGCHVFIEKPVSHTLAGTADLVDAVGERQLTAMVGYNLRFHPALTAVKQLVEMNEIGTVLSARVWVGQYLPDWQPGLDYRESYACRSELGGGVILTLSHEVDYVHWLLGDVAQITAVTSQPSDLEMNVESLAELTMMHRSGVITQIHLDCLRRPPSRGCELIGSHGTICCDLNRSEVRLYKTGGREPTVMPLAFDDVNRMYLDEVNHFIECIRSGLTPRVSLADGIAVLGMAMAAHRAAETGERQLCN